MVDYTGIYKNFKKKWIALSPEPLNSTEVVGSGDTLKEALKEAESKGIINPVVYKVPDFQYTYVL